MIKTCNACKHTWTNIAWACAKCGSMDIDYKEEVATLPIGIEYKVVPELNDWVRAMKPIIAKMPKGE